MRKYLISNYTQKKVDKKTASSKAIEDIAFFLGDIGFCEIKYINPIGKLEKRIKRIFYSKYFFKKNLKELDSSDSVVLQYPLYSSILEYNLYSSLKKCVAKKTVVIHDLESLRNCRNKEKNKKWEKTFLSIFDVVISHNDRMTEYLREIGIVNNIRNIELFDYEEKNVARNVNMHLPICYAGNLKKSKFLEKVHGSQEYNVYGIFPSEKYSKNIDYKGAFPSDQLARNIEGSFGLVWDGTSIDSCDGVLGEYLKFNNPHKTSLYLSLGMPVIVWKKAAIANFVEKNNVGIVVNNLIEIESKLKSMTEEEYNYLKRNSELMSMKVKSGYFIKNVV